MKNEMKSQVNIVILRSCCYDELKSIIVDVVSEVIKVTSLVTWLTGEVNTSATQMRADILTPYSLLPIYLKLIKTC